MSTFRFGPFALDRSAYRLSKDGEPLTLPPKVLDLLFLLVSRPGALVSKDDILAALWPGIAVTDNAITQVVSDLRQALGDSSSSPAYLQTVPRRGYRFIAAVEATETVSPAAPARADDGSRPARRSIAVLDFTNVTGEASVTWLGSGIAETVTNDLRAIGGMTVIDRPLVANARLSEAGRGAVAPDLLVTGSYQLAGDRLRITARVVETATREVVVQAKTDGPLSDVFALQDAIVEQLGAGLRLRISPAAQARLNVRETSSLEAYRAVTLGRLKLEALDLAQVPEAVADFERALALDPAYALAHVGLAHARFWIFQASRARLRPDRASLEAAIAHARRAIDLHPSLAEAYSALGFFLASADRAAEGVVAGRRALELEPGSWRHQFRLGMAAWGDERQQWLEAVVAQFPMLTYAYFGMAMLSVARGRLSEAVGILQAGLVFADRPGAAADRFPSSGLHWLAGAIRFAQDDLPGARRCFEQELSSSGSRLYAAEYTRDACEGLGYLQLETGDAAGAAAAFSRSLEQFPEHPRSLVGFAAACRRLEGETSGRAREADAQARRSIGELGRGGRMSEAALSEAVWLIARDARSDAIDVLRAWISSAPAGSAGWIVPVEPGLRALRREPRAADVLAMLAQRAR